MKPTSGADKDDLHRMPCAKSGRRLRAGGSGLLDADWKISFESVGTKKLLVLVAHQGLADGHGLRTRGGVAERQSDTLPPMPMVLFVMT